MKHKEVTPETVRLSSAVQEMLKENQLRDIAEGEYFQEMARLRGQPFNSHRIIVPWQVFHRDLTAAQAPAGGYLVATGNGVPQDLLRPWSVVISGGVIVEQGLVGYITIPVTKTGATMTWQSSEGSGPTTSTPSLSQSAMSPKVALSIINCSRNFMLQADPERWLRRELIRAAGAAVDLAVLTGSGASGQPLGILNTSGLSTQSGSSLAWSAVLAMKKNAALANAPDSGISFISTPTIRALLEGREKATGNGGFIWQDDKIANCPAYATTLAPAGTMVSGPLSGITVGFWDMEIEINQWEPSLFKTGAIQIRVLVGVDLAITVDLTAFTVATSIT